MSLRHQKIVMTLLVTAILLFSGTLSIGSETVTDTQVSIHAAPIPSQPSMSASASKVLRNIVNARASIHMGELNQAERELYAAMKLIEYIKAIRPSTQITDHIWIAEKHLESQKPTEVALDLIPIEISLTDIEAVHQIQQAKRHIENTRSRLAKQDMESTRKELIRLRESLDQTEVDLPLNSTEDHISKALKQLAGNDKTGADNALREAEAGVRFISLGNSTPLSKTRRLLWQALEDFSAGHHLAVKAGLTKALNMLGKIESASDPKSMHEAQRLRSEINELLQYEEQNTPEVESGITGLWHRTVALIEREAENLYHAWRDQQTENHLYRQLIDARFHLFYAGYDLFESGDLENAEGELKESINYLREAVSTASGLRKERILAIRKDVESILNHMENPDTKTRQEYDDALAELRRLIKEK
ncbi:MAG: YfdX family protein [Chromatiaceae bacterium]|nr:YfdX family protein [Chromatiaceae bacterium]